MALTRLDNLISSKTGKYLYVSPDDFNASDELNNRGNSPIRPFKSLQRAFIEISRFSYVPGIDNDRFDQFTVMVMPGNHYIDNRPGLTSSTGINAFNFDQALSEWNDDSILDLSDPNNILYKFNNTEGGVIIPRGSSIIGYDLRRTIVRPLYVPDPADPIEKRSAIFNVTGGTYFWQFTIKDGDLEPTSPLYNETDGVAKVYYQTPPADSPGSAWTDLAVPNFSHHKLTVFEYADKEELGIYYQKVAKAFSQFQPTIDDANEFGDRIEENRIVGPLSDIRAIESIKCTDSSPRGTITVEITTKVNHGYFRNQFIAVENNGLDDQIDGTFAISSLDLVDKKKFSYQIPGSVSALGTNTSLVSGTTYTTSNGLNSNAVVKAEVDSVESASPYVFNCSIRSTWGICGIWANGLKATGFKSMVIAQYTGVSLQKDDRAFIRYDEFTNTFNQASLTDAFATVPYHTKGDAFWKDDWRNFHVRASEDSFIQCVSIFAVGFADHFLMESGGDMSITNSNSNFGNTSLHAIGFKGFAFNQDKGGFITDIVPPQTVDESSGNVRRQSYYTLDVYASNDPSNNTKIYHGDDQAIDPKKRPAATIGGYRIGAKTDDKLYVKLNPRTAGGNNTFFATLEPSGFKKFTATADILNPSGVTINNKILDAADRIEANKDFIAHEAYDRILAKYPALKVKETITITKCRRDVGYLIDATIQDLRLGGNINTIQAAESYYVGTNLSYIDGELTETLEGYNYAKDLAIAAMRNFSYLRTGVDTTNNSAIVNIGDTSGVVEGMTVADYDPSQFTNGKLNSNATRPTTPVIPDNTFVKRVLDSASIELGDNTQTAQKQFVQDRFGDARALIVNNKTFIANEAYDRMLLDYPSYTSATGYTKATFITDLENAIESVADNTGFGGNAETWDIADFYERGAISNASTNKDETLAAFNYTKDMAIQVMRKENVFVFGSHGLTQDFTTANDPVTVDQAELVADRNGDARNLILANKNLIAAESVDRMIIESSTQKYTPTNAVYDAETGEMVITVTAHGMTKASVHTVTNAVYTPSDGKLVLTIAGHGFTNGQRILIKDNSITFTCTKDSNATQHTYPRATDPSSGKWLTISNKTTDTFEVNVGASDPTDQYAHTFVSAVSNGVLGENDAVRIDFNSLNFTCGMDGNATQHSYPRSGDPAGASILPLIESTTDTFTINVGKSLTTSFDVTDADYNAATGDLQLTIDDHDFHEGQSIRIADGSLKFRCSQDSFATDHLYPRGDTTQHTPTNAVYNPTTGIITFTVNAHGFENLDLIKVVDNSLTFTCAADNNQTQKTYPRNTDPISGKFVPISNVTQNTFDIQTLDITPSTNTSVHTFVSAAANAIERRKDRAYQNALKITKVGSSFFTPTGAAYTPANGDLVFTKTAHGLVDGDRIRLATDSLTFTCAMDNNATEHKYPRESDPVDGEWLTVSNTTADTFKVIVGAAGSNQTFTPSDATYDPASGDLTLTIGAHSLKKGKGVLIENGAVSFKCTMDGNDTAQAYPRAGRDQASGRSLKITNVTATTITVKVGNAGTNKFFKPSTASYNAATGEMVAVIGQHGLRVGDDIVLKDNSLTFTCSKDNNATQHSYPRPNTDPFAGKSIRITDVSSSDHTATNAVYDPTSGDLTLTVANHGFNGPAVFTPTDASYNPTTGIVTLTIANHGLENNDFVRIADYALTFTCTQDGNLTNHSYPRPNDPASNRALTVSNVTTNTFDVQILDYTPSTNTTVHTFVSAVANSVSNGGDYIQVADGSLTFTCSLDGNTAQKTYPRAGFDFPSNRWLQIRNKTVNTFTVNVGKSSDNSTHTFVSAVANGIKKQTGEITFNVGVSSANDQYTHTFVSALNEAIQYLPQSAHTFDSGVANSVKYEPSSVHTFKRAATNAIEKQAGTITVNVGASAPGQQYDHQFVAATDLTPTNADYNPTTGVLVLTVANHGMQTDDFVKIADNAIVFTCSQDNNATNHAYPRSTDPISNKYVKITVSDANTFSLQTLKNIPSTNTTTHTFVSAVANSVNRAVVKGGGNYTHTFKSAKTDSVHKIFSVAGNRTYHNSDCVDDVRDLLEAVADNVAFGGNDKTWDAAYSYKTGAHVAGEETETNIVFEHAKDMAAQVIKNQKILAVGSHKLHQTFDTTITLDTQIPINERAGDASDLLISNAAFIAAEAYERMILNHPGFLPPTGNQQDCIDDIKDFVVEVAFNVGFGGNDRVWDMANLYVKGAHVAGEETQTLEAFQDATQIAIQAMRNEKVLVVGKHGLTQTFDNTIASDNISIVSDEAGDSATLLTLNRQFIADIAQGRMLANNPGYTPPINYPISDFNDDLLDVIDVIAFNIKHGGTDRVWDTANLYVAGAIQGVSVTETVEAINHLKDIAVQIIKSDAVTVGGHTTANQVIYSGANTTNWTDAQLATEISNINTLSTILTNAISNNSTLNDVARVQSVFTYNDVEASITTLSTIVQNAISAPETLAAVTRTGHTGSARCDNVKSTIDTLFKIVTDTVTTPTSLNNVIRNISNGPCQNVASAVTTLYKLITDTITTQGNLSSIERNVAPLGLSTGNPVNATANTTNTYLYFTLPSGRYTTTYTPNVDETITQDTTYPECVGVSDTIRQYFANITTIIQTGVGTVTRTQPSSASSNLAARATIWGLKDWTPGPTSGSNPHQLETGTPIRLVPRPRYDTTTNQYVDVDKRNVRLPNGFDTNREYYAIAPGRITKPEDYSGTTTFNGSDQTKLMLASSKDNAAAGIYIHSSEVEAIHPDIEIDIYQFVLDDKYDLHEYGCVLSTAVSGGIITDIPHIFDVPNASVEPHEVFFRKNEGGNLPVVGGSSANDPDVADSNSRLRGDKFFFAKYNTAKVITIHKTHADAIAGTNPIIFVPLNSGTYNFSVFACKRESPMKYDPTYDGNVGTTDKGKWYLQVKNESSNSQSILGRFHDAEYNDSSGNNKTNDSYYERIDDSDREANDRIYRLRYVIPKYLKSVRDPLNGFSIKARKDDTRKLLPQKIRLKPVTGNVTKAKFFNTSDSGNANEVIGFTDADFTSNSIAKTNASGENVFYDPYKKDTKGTKNYLRNIETSNFVSMSIESGRYYTEGSDEFLELTVFDHNITNTGLKNENFTTVKITAPQGGNFTANKTASTNANAVTWVGNSSGSGFIHAALNVPNTNTWHLIIKGVTGDIKYSSTDNIRFTQGVVFADLLDFPDSGKSLVRKDLIKEGLSQFFYRQNGAKVYTITPGDIITDAANIQFYVESVVDVGEIDETFYVYDVQEIQRRIFDQQDGIFYLTAVRGNISPFPQGAGNLGNFRNFKFSQPISKLFPLDFKNDPVWFKQIDPNAKDPGQTYSAADNYVHGLVTVNDFKGSLTKESVTDFLATEALKNNNYTGNNKLEAQSGNASAGSEDRKIPIAGDSTVVVDQRLYVELRRPSIARAGNHTFEYLGFGPGNYSTGLPARQEVLLTVEQDFFAQSKKQDGGLVFYTGLNSNGDLYIGNRKIDAITGEEIFLESASLAASEDEDDAIGNLVTTFDTPVTFNEYITVNGGENGDQTSTFNSPVTINVSADVRDQTLGLPNVGVLSALKVVSNVSSTDDDATLDRTAMTKNRQTNGDVLIAGNRVTAGVFQFNQRGSLGSGQGYKIQTHAVASQASNITPDQDGTYDISQVVSYGGAGAPLTGDILLKGESVGSSGSLGWIFSNSFVTITSQIEKFIFNSTRTVTIQWKSGVTNGNVITGGLIAGQEIKLTGLSENKLNGTFIINTGFSNGSNTCTFSIAVNDTISSGELVFNNTNTPNAVVKLANASWKEVGVLGAQTIRTDTQTIGEYKIGINTVARAAHVDYADAFVSAATNPLANLDVVGTAWISGKTIENFAAHATYAARTQTAQDHAFMVGGDSSAPQTAATFRVSTTNNGRVGINTTLASMNSALTVTGTSEFTDNAIFQDDISVNGGGAGSANSADINTTITNGTATLFNNNTFVGLTTGTRPTQGLLIGGSVRNIEIGNVTTGSQNIKIGNTSNDSEITIGDSIDGTNANKSKITLGGAFASTESDSFVQIDTKALKISGDTIIGTRRGLSDVTKFESPSGTVEFLSGNSATSIVDFATNAATLTIAGQGGTTTIRNNLRVNATTRFDADVTLCGGFASYSFVGFRAQAGSDIQTHASGILGNNQYNNNVDLISVAAFASTTPTGEYNQIDTSGSGTWGGSAFQQTPAGQSAATFPVLSGDKYYLPIKKSPYDASGAQYYNENDILLIDTEEQSGRHAEFVKITRLPQINSTPYYIEVQRQPFGTLSAITSTHPDTTAIFKCTIQFGATWITQSIDGSGTEDNVYLSQFGGSLVGRSNRQTGGDPAYVSTSAPGDYVIITRTATGNDGEIFELKETLAQVAKKFAVKNGCDTNNENTLFEVDSVNGAITVNGDQSYTGGLTLNGSCTTPYQNVTTNKKLTITNGSGITTFEVDTCTGDTQIGNSHGTVFMVSEAFGTAPAAYAKNQDLVYIYRHDPESINADGPRTTVASNVGSADSTIKIASNYTKFVTGDLVAIVSGTSAIEIAQITSASTLTGSDQILNFATNTTYPNGGRGSSSNKIEGTVAQSWNVGAEVVKIRKYESTTTLMHDIPATRSARASAIQARTPNTFDRRLEIQLTNADLIQPKLDYIQYVRIGEEFFLPDSVHGGAGWSATAGLDAEFAVKLPKQYRNPNTVGTALIDLFGGGAIRSNGDFELTSGNLRMYGSDGITPVLFIANDDGHLGDGSTKDPVTNTSGLQLYGPGTIHGNLQVKSKDCQAYGDCGATTTFSVVSLTGDTSIGEKFYQKGKISATEISSESVFHIDNLGASGATNPKDFRIYQNNAIDSFGIEKYWTGNGGRRHTYVAYDPTTGIGQQVANPLQVNNNYLINSSSGANMVIYLPDNAQTGDMIRFVELSGNLTYNTSLIIRALKIANVPTAIQGDTSGTKIGAGSNVTTTTAWDSGELVIQTRNASFGLVFAGSVDIEGSANAQTIPPSLRGWWLMEL